MDAKKKEAIMECSSFDELLNAEYGERGTEARENFEAEAEAFAQDKIMNTKTPKKKNSYIRSQEDKMAGRVEKFSSSEEMFKSLGI